MIGTPGLRFALAAVAALATLASDPALAVTGASDPAEILTRDAYRFCHEPDYPLYEEERAWCPLVGKHSTTCPMLPAACAAPPDEAAIQRRRDGEYEDDDLAKRRDSRDRQKKEDDESSLSKLKLPSLTVSTLAEVLFFAMIVGGIWVVLRAVSRARLTQSAHDEDVDDASEPAPLPAGSSAPPGPVETDVARLLARAQAAAARGDYDRALADAHAALLRKLDGHGLIELHPCRTNGDYVRALADRTDRADRAELRAAVRAIFRDVESAQFGAVPASRTAFEAVYDRVVPLVSRALGAALLCLFAATAGLSCDGHGLSRALTWGGTSPSGTRALAELLADRGVPVRRRTRPLSHPVGEPVALVLLAGAEVAPETWPELFTWVEEEGGVLVIAGPEAPAELTKIHRKFEPRAEPALMVGQGFEELVGAEALAVPGKGALSSQRSGRTMLERALASEKAGRSFSSDLEDGEPEGAESGQFAPYAAHYRLGNGTVVVIADSGMFTNIALAVGSNGDFIAALLASFDLPVELCDHWTGKGATSPIASVRDAELTPAMLQLLALAGVLLLWKGRAFGALRDPPERSRRAFAEHVRALGLCYARARAASHVCGLYAGWALDRLREQNHGGARAGLVPLAAAIAARTGRPEAEVIEVLVEAHGARGTTGGAAEPAHALALMRSLTSLLAATSKRKPRTP